MSDPIATAPRGLDHLVIGVSDIEKAAEFYTRLGFKVGARNRHPWARKTGSSSFRAASSS